MALLRYTLLRVLLFLAVAALLWIVGLRDLWLVLFAILGSGIVSIFALSRSRDAASVALSDRLSTIKGRVAERTAAEDAWDDQQRAGRPGPGDDQRDGGYETGVTEDRRTQQRPTQGEDPRERDAETTSPAALDKIAGQEGLVNPPDRVGGLGASSDAAPGADLPDLDDAAEVTRLRDEA
jgi:hypothetical protein